jgi:hypothetical protein
MFCTTFVLIFSFQGYPLYKAKQLQRKRREEGADLLAVTVPLNGFRGWMNLPMMGKPQDGSEGDQRESLTK